MSFVLGARSVVASRHLDAMLSAYADRSLPAETLLLCDQHVAICPGCRHAVDAERRLLSSLRTAATPEVSSRLETALLGLGLDAMSVPTRPSSPLTLVGRSAPAMHRSPVRAALLASLVAGASAAAAWSVGVAGASPSASSVPPARPPASAAVSTSGGNGSSGQEASFLSIGRAAGMAGSNGLTPTFTTASAGVVPAAAAIPVAVSVAGPRPYVPDMSRRWETIDP